MSKLATVRSWLTSDENRKQRLQGIAVVTVVAVASYLLWRNRKKRKYDQNMWCDGEFLEKMEKVIVPTDVITCTPSKCGQTWLQNILFHLKHKGQRALDQHLLDEMPWVECLLDTKKSTTQKKFCKRSHQEMLDNISGLSHPRVFKMHVEYKNIPFNPVGPKCKVITIARDPRDVAYSAFKHMKAMNMEFEFPWYFTVMKWLGMFPDFAKIDFETYFGMSLNSSFNNMVTIPKSFWPHRHESHLLWLRYEDLQTDLKGQLRKIAQFLEWHDVSDQVIERVVPLVHIDRLRENEKMLFGDMFTKDNATFFREGKVGKNWQQLTPEMERRLIDFYKKAWEPDLVKFMFVQGNV